MSSNELFLNKYSYNWVKSNFEFYDENKKNELYKLATQDNGMLLYEVVRSPQAHLCVIHNLLRARSPITDYNTFIIICYHYFLYKTYNNDVIKKCYNNIFKCLYFKTNKQFDITFYLLKFQSNIFKSMIDEYLDYKQQFIEKANIYNTVINTFKDIILQPMIVINESYDFVNLLDVIKKNNDIMQKNNKKNNDIMQNNNGYKYFNELSRNSIIYPIFDFLNIYFDPKKTPNYNTVIINQILNVIPIINYNEYNYIKECLPTDYYNSNKEHIKERIISLGNLQVNIDILLNIDLIEIKKIKIDNTNQDIPNLNKNLYKDIVFGILVCGNINYIQNLFEILYEKIKEHKSEAIIKINTEDIRFLISKIPILNLCKIIDNFTVSQLNINSIKEIKDLITTNTSDELPKNKININLVPNYKTFINNKEIINIIKHNRLSYYIEFQFTSRQPS